MFQLSDTRQQLQAKARDLAEGVFRDRAAEIETNLLREGTLTPTHLMAWMATEPPDGPLHFEGPAPRDCVRDPEAAPER